jgi:hypothetical protein
MICEDPRRALSLLETEFLAGFFCPPCSREGPKLAWPVG